MKLILHLPTDETNRDKQVSGRIFYASRVETAGSVSSFCQAQILLIYLNRMEVVMVTHGTERERGGEGEGDAGGLVFFLRRHQKMELTLAGRVFCAIRPTLLIPYTRSNRDRHGKICKHVGERIQICVTRHRDARLRRV